MESRYKAKLKFKYETVKTVEKEAFVYEYEQVPF